MKKHGELSREEAAKAIKAYRERRGWLTEGTPKGTPEVPKDVPLDWDDPEERAAIQEEGRSPEERR